MERERKQLYEVMFIINAQLSEEAREKALARIKQNIEDQGGICLLYTSPSPRD